jgi:hypothetical protein
MSDKAEPAAPSGEVVQFPTTEEEKNRRVMAEVKRLACLAPGEWKLWAPKRAGELGIEPKLLTELVEAQLKDNAEKERKAQEEARLGEERARRLRLTERDRQREQQRIDDAAEKKSKKKAKALADIIKLPSAEQEAKLTELAKEVGEDAASLGAEFAEYCSAEAPSSSGMSEWDDEPWSEPVATAVVLEELIARINQHIKAKPHQVLAIALWVLMAWVHEVAAHYSLYLFATAPKEDCGKTTLIVEVVGRLVPKPYVSGSDPTIASIFRTADRDNPTMLFDNVDTLFQRKPEVTELFLSGWTRGIKISRVERINGNWQTVWYDPFCPKACSLIGTNLPPPLLGRCLLIELWPMKPGETVVEVNPFNQELMDAFKTLRRKLARWSNDNALTLKTAAPLFPAGFTSRPRANAKLLLAIAEMAGDGWAEQARAAVDKLLREKREPHTVTQREIAALLRKVRIRPRLVGKTRLGGYHRADFLEKEIFQHFLGRDPLILSPEAERKSSRSRRKKARG